MASQFRPTVCACSNFRRATRAVSHLYDLVLAPMHLKASQFMILQAIGASGSIAHCDLAREFAASVETLSRRLASARRAGLVHMKVGDRYKRVYSLTLEGQQLLEEATPLWDRAQYRLRHALGEEDWQLLASFAERVTAAAIRAESMPLSNGKTRSPASHALKVVSPIHQSNTVARSARLIRVK
jgi:DNA-binding MarR family transcriptional regulator